MITSYDKLTISQRDAISEIINGVGTDSEKDLQILRVLGFEPDDHDVLETKEALEKAKFLLKPCPEKKLKTFQYNGYTFKVPSMSDINYSQYVDLCNSTDNAGLLKAICVPEGHKYGEVDIDFSNLPYPIASSVISPFVRSWLKSSNRTLRSLVSIMKVRALFSKAYRKRVSSVLDLYGSISQRLSLTRWV